MGYDIETVNFHTEAKAQIAVAREMGHDPWDIYIGHLGLARAIKRLLDEEVSDEASDDLGRSQMMSDMGEGLNPYRAAKGEQNDEGSET